MDEQEAATDEVTQDDEITLDPDEQEQADSEPGDEQGDEPEAETESAGPSQKDIEQMFGRIERSYKTYDAAVKRNLDDQAEDWLGCPLCAGGAIPGFFNRHDIGNIPEAVEANVRMVLGLATEKQYPHSGRHDTCVDCEGLGKVSTGSRVPEHAHIICPNCRGYGYMPPPPRHGEQPTGNGEVPAAVVADPSDFDQPERDNWGEPRILPDGTLNENYGKQPQFKARHPVYGETRLLTGAELAGLTAETAA